MHFTNQMQIINFKSTQTFIIKINLNNALKFNPFFQQLLNTPISNIRLARSTHPHDNCRRSLFLNKIQMTPLNILRDAIFIEFAQYFTYYLFRGEYCTKLLFKHQQHWQSLSGGEQNENFRASKMRQLVFARKSSCKQPPRQPALRRAGWVAVHNSRAHQ